MPPRNEKERLNILSYYDRGVGYAELHARFHVKKKTVDRYVQMRAHQGHVHDAPRTGRKRKLSTRNGQEVVRMLTDQHLGTRETAKRISRRHVQVSQPTIVREAHRHGLQRVEEMVVPKLTAAQKVKRVEWCQAHINDDWTEYMFTDESYFPFQSHAKTVWRRPSKPPPKKAQSKFIQKILVWGGVSYYGKTPLIIRPPGKTLKAQDYIEILEEVFPDSATELFVILNGTSSKTMLLHIKLE